MRQQWNLLKLLCRTTNPLKNFHFLSHVKIQLTWTHFQNQIRSCLCTSNKALPGKRLDRPRLFTTIYPLYLSQRFQSLTTLNKTTFIKLRSMTLMMKRTLIILHNKRNWVYLNLHFMRQSLVWTNALDGHLSKHQSPTTRASLRLLQRNKRLIQTLK